MNLQELANEHKRLHKVLNDFLSSMNEKHHGYIEANSRGGFRVMCNMSVDGYGDTQWIHINEKWKAIEDKSNLSSSEVRQLIEHIKELLE